MPSPYVQDLFEQLANDPRIDLRVLYLEQEAPDTHWGPQSMPSYASVLPGRWLGVGGARIHLNPTVRSALDNSLADLTIVVGYVGLTNQLAMWHLSRHQRPWAFWGEIPGLHRRGRIGNWLRSRAQSPLKLASGIAAVGSHAVAEYRRIVDDMNGPRLSGPSKEDSDCHKPVFRNLPYVCDIGTFAAAAKSRTSASTLRFLYCGQLIERKGVDLLMTAMENLIADGFDASLDLIGEGPLRGSLESRLNEHSQGRIRFLGFRPVGDLPLLFSDADVFILPSRHDGWGVVVNQAVGAGMPIIATETVGASNDLVKPGENGFRIAVDSCEAIVSAMKSLCMDRSMVKEFGQRSTEISQLVELRNASNQWYEFFTSALNASDH